MTDANSSRRPWAVDELSMVMSPSVVTAALGSLDW
jgi:hypothetical protein